MNNGAPFDSSASFDARILKSLKSAVEDEVIFFIKLRYY